MVICFSIFKNIRTGALIIIYNLGSPFVINAIRSNSDRYLSIRSLGGFSEPLKLGFSKNTDIH